MHTLSPPLGVGVCIWFRWDQDWAAATLERRANTRECLSETDGAYVPLEDSPRILDDDDPRAVVHFFCPNAAAAASETLTSRSTQRATPVFCSRCRS